MQGLVPEEARVVAGQHWSVRNDCEVKRVPRMGKVCRENSKGGGEW
jgi:hypothetical protein